MNRYGVQQRLTYLGGGVRVQQAMWPSASSGGWWNNNGAISGAVAAWAAKGAASKAASLSDLTGNGYDLTEIGTVTFDSSVGWGGWSGYYNNGTTPVGTINGLSFTNLINAGVIGANGARSVLVRCTPTTATNMALVTLAQNGTTNYASWVITPEVAVRIYGGNAVFGGGLTSDNVIGITAPASQTTNDILAYINGSSEAIDSSVDQTPNTTTSNLGLLGIGSNASGTPLSGTILAVAIYSVQLSASDVATISTAMAAL